MPQRPDTNDRRSRSERREYIRLNTTTSVRFLRSGATPEDVLSAELIDVSHCGIRILLDRPLIKGECILIEVRDADGRCCNLSAQAVWIESEFDQQHRVGCELRVELTRKQFTLLRELVAQPQG